MKKIVLAAAVLACLAATPAVADTYTGTGFAILDRTGTTPSTASSSIAVTAPGTVHAVSVTLNGLAHTFAGDLIATLSNGTISVDLFNRLGVPQSTFGNAADFAGTYSFSDSATMSLPETSTGGFIASGSYLPADAFSAFTGQNIAGNWTLSISDNAGGDIGALQGWSLNLNDASVVAAVPEPSTWAMMIIGFGAAGASLRRRKSKVTTRVAFV